MSCRRYCINLSRSIDRFCWPCCCVRSTGIFVFLYALFYYFKRSNMSGALQSIEFFGYTFLACYVFFLMLGTVSFAASLKFIRYIYVNIKMDWITRTSRKHVLWPRWGLPLFQRKPVRSRAIFKGDREQIVGFVLLGESVYFLGKYLSFSAFTLLAGLCSL